MKSCVKYFVLLFCLHFIEGAFRCDYKYSSTAKAWFKHVIVPATWSDARLRCTLEGATLASPTTLEMKTEMINIIKASSLKQEIFTGIHAYFSQGDYHTIEGTPLSKIPVIWVEDEPDNKDNTESCITFTRNGEVADRPCYDTRPYICYRPETEPEVEVNECGTVDSAYRLDRRTNKCYKFHLQGRNFTRASFACSAEGGHLAIINSDVEAAVLQEIFNTVDKNKIMGVNAMWKDLALIGIHDWGERGEWRTIHGQTLSEAGYSRWYSGEPTLYANEYCAALWRNRLIYDAGCDTPLPFFCEKSPQYPAVCRADHQ
ncbi:hypothetical protein PYW07_009895 [Mythimna separata]|uniref:C-type lectin domain-containing protein n=2 Tax=Mythimna separata TaxID=271217 RepID=A0AAD8DR72_MYTSE|nr:hypothetical protein PYW07_009895 [Mythimna separata]